MTKIVDWIWKAPAPEERLKRIEEFLTNEGYSLPAPPRGVDRSEQGEKHVVYGEVWTVRERYDVPELGLVDVTVDQILTAIYEQYVLAPSREKPPIQVEGVRLVQGPAKI